MTPRARRTPSSESGETRVVAVFRHRAYAEQVAEELERAALPGMRIAIEDRRATDDVPTEPPAPVVEADERRRDAEVAGHVGRNVLGLSIAYAAGLAIIGGLVAWGLTGLGSRWFWVALAVGAVTGAVLGGIQGGIGAAMSESEKEEGSLLIVSLQDASAAKQAERTIREHDPARVDVQHGGRLAG